MDVKLYDLVMIEYFGHYNPNIEYVRVHHQSNTNVDWHSHKLDDKVCPISFEQ